MTMADPSSEHVRRALVTVLRELIDGTASDMCWVLNLGDRGFQASLDGLSADAASAQPGPGRSRSRRTSSTSATASSFPIAGLVASPIRGPTRPLRRAGGAST